MTHPLRHTQRVLAASAVIVLFATSGCASYLDHIKKAQNELRAGNPDAAIELVDKRLDVEKGRLPADLDGDATLLLVERATLFQAKGQYELAARDMMVADQRMEWLDIGRSDAGEVFGQVYSGGGGRYRSPPYERLLLNTLNMVNFLAAGNYQSAKVEARRFSVMESFFEDSGDDEHVLPELRGLGNYLGGVSFESTREYRNAARYYARAYAFGYRDDDVESRLVALLRLTGYKAREVATSEGVAALLAAANSAGPLSTADYERSHRTGDTLVVLQYGLAPYKRAERIPIGAALLYASHAPHLYHGSHHRDANMLIASGVLKWVMIPKLVSHPARSRSVGLSVDGSSRSFGEAVDIGVQVELAWRRMLGPIVAAAVVRMIGRALAGQAARVATSQLAKNEGSRASTAGALGWLAAVAVEGILTVVDTPDTRSWTTLPDQIRLTRMQLAPGKPHLIAASVGARTHSESVVTRAGPTTVVNFSRLR